MQKPKYFRVAIPVEEKSLIDPILGFVEGLKGSKITLNFGEYRNKKEFDYLIEDSDLTIYYSVNGRKGYPRLSLRFRQINSN
jgi:hypothetical protein